MTHYARELAALAEELAPERGRSSYGEPAVGLLPGDIYRETQALDTLEKVRKARMNTSKILGALHIEL